MSPTKRACARAATELEKETDHLDVLVNNAGIHLDGDKAILKTIAAKFEKTFRTNTSVRSWSRRLSIRLLKKSEAPRIVNVSSGGGQLPTAPRMGAGLLHFENRVERRHLSTGRGVAEIRRQFRLPRLGAEPTWAEQARRVQLQKALLAIVWLASEMRHKSNRKISA